MIIGSCSEHGCKLVLNDIGNHVVLKGERICQDRKMCDCIVFAHTQGMIISIVELKGRTAHASEIVEKLTNGSLAALSILEKCSSHRLRFEFYHIVLCKSWSVSEYIVINSRKIKFRGKKYDILQKRCGVSLGRLLSSLK